MKRQNYSRKREAILHTLQNTQIHPTAEWIYLQLKHEFPDLSLGTVYRNLAQFKADEKINSVGIVNGQERFDGNTQPHSHFVCTHCGAVLDIFSPLYEESSLLKIADSLHISVDSCDLVLRGTCSNCMKKH